MALPERQLERLQIMMSMSESPDLGALGMGRQHFQEAMKEIARHLLADGATLAYGGDLRERKDGGLTWLLFDMALAYNAASSEGGTTKIMNYLASTAWQAKGAKDQVELGIRREYRGAAKPICLPPPTEVEDRISGRLYDPGDPRDAIALTDMRQRIIADSQALVCLGGRVSGSSGGYPGVLEEIALSLMAKCPIYLLGGFGGATADAARAILGTSPIDPETRRLDDGYAWGYGEAMDFIKQCEGELTPNGLDAEEIRTLATAVEIQIVIPLLLRGLRAIARERQDPRRNAIGVS